MRRDCAPFPAAPAARSLNVALYEQPNPGNVMKTTLRIAGVAGVLIFGIFLYFTYGIPGYVEEIGKEFIQNQIMEKTDEKIENLKHDSKDSKLAQLAAQLYQQQQEEIDSLKAQLRSQAHEQLAAVIAEMRDLNCECRNKYAQMYKDGFEFRLASLQTANEKLQDFMKTKYMEVASELKRDVRIFTGSNMLVFLLLLSVSFLKPKAISHLFVPGTLLTTATLVCSYFYVFQQNWLLTIIYNDYLGFAYLGYVFVVFLFLCDIVFNRARVTTEIINGILNVIGSASSVVAC